MNYYDDQHLCPNISYLRSVKKTNLIIPFSYLFTHYFQNNNFNLYHKNIFIDIYFKFDFRIIEDDSYTSTLSKNHNRISREGNSITNRFVAIQKNRTMDIQYNIMDNEKNNIKKKEYKCDIIE
jgi:hypothetical protein